MALNVGDTLGAYRLVEQLGQGGMATVFKAYHAALDRYVAIKVLHPAFNADPNFQARFQREARVVARLEHPNIVPVYDYAEHAGEPYLVMKFIEGETLKTRLMRAPAPADEVMRIVEAMGAALEYAHRQGILHRDIKPSNVMLAKDGTVYLADFGLARLAEAGESTLSADAMLGTPQYMSPEQARGVKALDAGTDLYSFGVVVYELVVGRAPFNADTPLAVIHDHVYTPLPSPRVLNPAVPEAVEAVLHKALAKERADRYATAAEMVAALRAALVPAAGGGAIALARTHPADPAAETPAAATVAATTPATVARPAAELAAPTGVHTAAAPADAVPPRRGTPWWLAAVGAALVVALLLGAFFLARQGRQRNAVRLTQTAAVSVVSAEPTLPPVTSAVTAEPSATPDMAALLAAAEAAFAAGNHEEAVALLNQLLVPGTSSADLTRAGDLLLVNGHTFDAIEYFYTPARRLEEGSPTDAGPVLQAHTTLAYYVLAADEAAKPILDGMNAEASTGSLVNLAWLRSQAFFANGAGVEAGLSAIIDETPNHEGALLLMGDYYLSRGQEVLATRFYQRVRDLPRPANLARQTWVELEARCNLEKLRRLRSAATLEATCEDLSLLLTGR